MTVATALDMIVRINPPVICPASYHVNDLIVNVMGLGWLTIFVCFSDYLKRGADLGG